MNNSSDRRDSSWDVKNAGTNYISLIALQIGAAVFTFASVSLLTRYFGAEGYGGVAVILVASQIVQIFIMWTATALTRFGVQEFIETGQISVTFWTRTFILIPNLILVVLLSPFWLEPLAFWLKLPAESFLYVVLNLIANAAWIHIQFALQGAKLPRMYSFLMMCERLVSFFILVLFFLIRELSLFSAILAYTISPIIVSIAGIRVLKPYISRKVVITRQRVKDILIFSFPLIFYSMLSYLSSNHIDTFFILQYLTMTDLGIYTVAFQINGMLLQLPFLGGLLIMPLFVTSQTTNQESGYSVSFFQNVLPSITLLVSFLCVLTVALSFYLLPFVFGESFRQVGVLLFVFISAFSFATPSLVGFIPLSNSTSTTYVATIAAGATGSTNILFNFLLVPYYGLIGCSWATSLSFAVSLLTFAFIFRHKLKVPCSLSLLATLPGTFCSVFFWISGNVILSVLVFLVSGSILLIWKREFLFSGFQKLIAAGKPIVLSSRKALKLNGG